MERVPLVGPQPPFRKATMEPRAPADAMLDTVKAACNIDWPVTRLRVIVADDGRSARLQDKAEQLQATPRGHHRHYR